MPSSLACLTPCYTACGCTRRRRSIDRPASCDAVCRICAELVSVSWVACATSATAMRTWSAAVACCLVDSSISRTASVVVPTRSEICLNAEATSANWRAQSSTGTATPRIMARPSRGPAWPAPGSRARRAWFRARGPAAAHTGRGRCDTRVSDSTTRYGCSWPASRTGRGWVRYAAVHTNMTPCAAAPEAPMVLLPHAGNNFVLTRSLHKNHGEKLSKNHRASIPHRNSRDAGAGVGVIIGEYSVREICHTEFNSDISFDRQTMLCLSIASEYSRPPARRAARSTPTFPQHDWRGQRHDDGKTWPRARPGERRRWPALTLARMSSVAPPPPRRHYNELARPRVPAPLRG